MTLTTLFVPTYKNMLRTLTGFLAKVEGQLPDRAETMPSR